MSDEEYVLRPIGTLRGSENDRYQVPRQPNKYWRNFAEISLLPSLNFEQALEDLSSFNKIWIIYLFHRNKTWKPKVMPPRSMVKRGVFATRSPHRPNPIGMSCVDLLEVSGRTLYIANHDILDGTPILDIKPYIPYADSFLEEKHGWLEEELYKDTYLVLWSEFSKEKLSFLKEKGVDLESYAQKLLEENPFPYPNRRIKEIMDNQYLLAYKTWRLQYFVDKERKSLTIDDIFSGYDSETLLGKKISRWSDVALHREFILHFTEHVLD